MMSRNEFGNNESDADPSCSQLLRDIEEISKALYLHNKPPNCLTSPSDVRSKSTGKNVLLDSKSKPYQNPLHGNVLHKDKKSSSLWNWKKPLKALAHIGHQKFNVSFFLHVHSIEGLPANFNDTSLSVHWKRKNKVLWTGPSRVSQGIAEFEDTLVHKCCVYGSRSGPHHSANYELKLCLIYASVIGSPGLDIGRHWVDLTRLLPLTLEELEGENRSGKWTTSFKLTGKAKGATLNVSFGFLVMRDNLVGLRSSMINVSELIKLKQDRLSMDEPGTSFGPSNGSRPLRRVGSVPSDLNRRSSLSSPSVHVKVCHEIFPNLGLELSKSIDFLYRKLTEGNMCSSEIFDTFEHFQMLNPRSDGIFESDKDINDDVCVNTDFTVIEQGIELSNKEHLKSEQSIPQVVIGSMIETIDVDEIIKDDDIPLDEEKKCHSDDNNCQSYPDGFLVDDYEYEENSVCTKGSAMEDLEKDFHKLLISESAGLGSPLSMTESIDQERYVEVKSNYKSGKMVKKSLTLDDITESVASDFLNMLGIERSFFGASSESDPESPRERLLKEFEKEALASGNFIVDLDCGGERAEFDCSAPGGSGCGDCEDFDLTLVIQAAEEEHERACQLLRKRRKAKMLVDLETEALMQEWGLNEQAFQSSPHTHSDGFGSPIELPPEDPVELPPLGEGFGPFIQTKGEGYLRSMNPSLFRNCRNVGNLVMQVSRLVVLPAEMGSDIMEVLQHLASVGIEKLSVQACKLLPLDEITGKTMQQISQEGMPREVVTERNAQHSVGGKKELKGYEMGSNYLLLEDLTPLAMDKIEALSIEGLRIQSGMSNVGATSSINPQSMGWMSVSEGKSSNFSRFLSLDGVAGLQLPDVRNISSQVDGLMDLSVTLDEWLRLDAGIIGDEDQISERTIMILAAHHAKCVDLVDGSLKRDTKWYKVSGGTYGLLGDYLIVALMVLLRDPLRNHEPVGTPMLALIQLERVFPHFMPKLCCPTLERSNREEEEEEEEEEKEGPPWFKITEVHLAGLNIKSGKNRFWGTRTQKQSGVRWLLASGMGKYQNASFSKSKAIVIQRGTTNQTEDVLWSISSHVDSIETHSKELAGSIPHIRNPDVIFPDTHVA